MLHIDKKQLKLLLMQKRKQIELPKYYGIGEIISGISIIITLCLSDFSKITVINPHYFQIIAWIFAFLVLSMGIFSFARNLIKSYSVDNLFAEILELDPTYEHPFDIVLIKTEARRGYYLVFKSKRWKCWLFPNYHCQDGPFDINNEMLYIRKALKRDLDIDMPIEISYIGNNISCKPSIPDKINKKYNFHYFQIMSASIDINSKKTFRFNGKKYSWKTLDAMYSNKNIVKKNKDVLDYVRKKCDMS